jgi:hypothetical protein
VETNPEAVALARELARRRQQPRSHGLDSGRQAPANAPHVDGLRAGPATSRSLDFELKWVGLDLPRHPLFDNPSVCKAYWIATYRSINDPETLAEYAKLAGPAIWARADAI